MADRSNGSFNLCLPSGISDGISDPVACITFFFLFSPFYSSSYSFSLFLSLSLSYYLLHHQSCCYCFLPYLLSLQENIYLGRIPKAIGEATFPPQLPKDQRP